MRSRNARLESGLFLFCVLMEMLRIRSVRGVLPPLVPGGVVPNPQPQPSPQPQPGELSPFIPPANTPAQFPICRSKPAVGYCTNINGNVQCNAPLNNNPNYKCVRNLRQPNNNVILCCPVTDLPGTNSVDQDSGGSLPDDSENSQEDRTHDERDIIDDDESGTTRYDPSESYRDRSPTIDDNPEFDGGGDADTQSETSNRPNCQNTQLLCDFRAPYCMEPTRFDEMVSRCPKTCNRCPGQIVDLNEICHRNQRLCYLREYFDLMAWQCPRTCRYSVRNRPRPTGRYSYVDPIGQSPQSQPQQQPQFQPQPTYFQQPSVANRNACVDAIDCSAWVKNDFCTNPFYSPETRRQNCPVLCGFCSAANFYG